MATDAKTLYWLCSLAVLSFSAAQDEVDLQTCNKTSVLDDLTNSIKVAVGLGEDLPSELSGQQAATLLLYMRNLTETLHNRQLKSCRPSKCPEPAAHVHGGLICVTVKDNRYCKAMCNHGYDFVFIRTGSLAYGVCDEKTGYQFYTHAPTSYELDTCRARGRDVHGIPSAYFPPDQDCMTTKSDPRLSDIVIQQSIKELAEQGIEAEAENACLYCGHQPRRDCC